MALQQGNQEIADLLLTHEKKSSNTAVPSAPSAANAHPSPSAPLPPESALPKDAPPSYDSLFPGDKK